MQLDYTNLTKIFQLETLVVIDKVEHKLKDIAELFVNAARDWDTFNQTEISILPELT